MTLDATLQAALAERRAQGLYRTRRISDAPQAPEMIIDGRRVVSFCSNDYLGLANHPDVISAFQRGLEQYGAGSGAAHLINGHSRAHHALEEELADFVGRPRTLLFSTGYMANLGVIGAVLGRDDAVFEDRLNHASLLDAGRLSGARLLRYQHGDPKSLQSQLATRSASRKLIVSDGVFSMDGDIAPLADLIRCKQTHDAWLMIDDAHGFGVLGEQGRGSIEHCAVAAEDIDILVGTLGKAFGTFGAFVAGSEILIETLIQQARSYIYTTALPPAVAEATRASLKIIRNEPERRERLPQLVKYFRAGAEQIGLPLMPSISPIQPLVIGDVGNTVSLSEALLERGILVSAIRPPTVPDGSARLRITFSAGHDESQIDRLLAALDEAQ